jgi:hypothetical protein
VGHRALVAYERTNRDYNLHRSHWGATDLRLKHAITESTPYGSETRNAWARDVHRALVEGEDAEQIIAEFGVERPYGTDVDPIPSEVGVSFETIITDHVDYLHHEAVFVVDLDFDVTAYRTFWLGFAHDSESISIAESPTIGHGLLRAVRWQGRDLLDDEYAQGRFVGMRRITARLVDLGVLDHAEAVELLVRETIAAADPGLELHVSLGTHSTPDETQGA